MRAELGVEDGTPGTMELARVARAVMLAALTLGLAGPAAAGDRREPASEQERGANPDAQAVAHDGGHGNALDCEATAIPGVSVLCVHGEDPPPAGADVDEKRTVAELATDTEATTAAAGGVTSTSCSGDGTSGKRVQAIYARASDVTDRSAQVVPLIREWAAATEQSFVESAAATGGVRRIRWVHGADCALDVDVVTMATTGDDSLGATIGALQSAGYSSASRKYLVWVDANVYCGIAQLYADSDAANNYNDGAFAMYARVDNGCWGYSYPPVEAHELMHNLGAVQSNSPNHSPYGHCLDDKDVMCYADGPGVVVATVCADIENERLFDCNKDDYFHTNPPAGSYLATKWNTANSSFLHSGPGSPDPPDGGSEDPVVKTSYSWWSGQMTASAHTVTKTVLPTADGTLTARLKFTGTKAARLRVYADDVLVEDVRQAGGMFVVEVDVTAGAVVKLRVGADTQVKWILRAYYPTVVV